MSQTAVWIPPSLCGCQLRITADFTDGSIVDGVTYRHPIPFTITDIQLINVCLGHTPQTLAMPDVIGLFDRDLINGGTKQSRGYLKYPIDNPSSAQCLYTFLSQYGGQTHSFPCGCKGHQLVDENKNISYMNHPLHSRKCSSHKNDTKDMKNAKADFVREQTATKASLD